MLWKRGFPPTTFGALLRKGPAFYPCRNRISALATQFSNIFLGCLQLLFSETFVTKNEWSTLVANHSIMIENLWQRKWMVSSKVSIFLDSTKLNYAPLRTTHNTRTIGMLVCLIQHCLFTTGARRLLKKNETVEFDCLIQQ